LESAGNKLELRSGAVQLIDSTSKVVRRWNFTGAFPVKWTGPKLAASSKDLATEELEVCHCGFKPSK
jgi:phage tail-like protein